MLWRYIFGNDGIVNAFLGWFGIDRAQAGRPTRTTR